MFFYIYHGSVVKQICLHKCTIYKLLYRLFATIYTLRDSRWLWLVQASKCNPPSRECDTKLIQAFLSKFIDIGLTLALAHTQNVLQRLLYSLNVHRIAHPSTHLDGYTHATTLRQRRFSAASSSCCHLYEWSIYLYVNSSFH